MLLRLQPFICLLVVLVTKAVIASSSNADDPYETGQLTAADVDDNLNFDWFISYQKATQEQDLVLPRPDLRDRIPIQVVDSTGEPFSCAQVQVQGTETTLPAATNGKLSLFPRLDQFGSGPWNVTIQPPGANCPNDCTATSIPAAVRADGEATAQARSGHNTALQTSQETVRLQVSDMVSSLPAQLDIALLMDTTGSMCDEVDYLKTELGAILSEAAAGIDVRMAYIAYKSSGDEPYDIKVSNFVGRDDNDQFFVQQLAPEECTGGGNGELVNEALQAAASQLEWRSGNVARLILIVGDEPPHGSPKEHMQQAVEAALDLRRLGVRVYGLAASQADERAEYLFRLISFLTGARYLWLTDDSGIGDSHAEPKVLCYQATHLDQLLYRVVRSELTGKRVEADPSHLIREVGRQEAGVCLTDLNPEEGKGGDPQLYLDDASLARSPSSSSVSSASSMLEWSFLAVWMSATLLPLCGWIAW